MKQQDDSPVKRGARGSDGQKKRRGRLRIGFSTGTAVSAAARAALRRLLTGERPDVVAVRLPGGIYLPVPVLETRSVGEDAWATVIKDGGDDPDVTHGAEIRVRVRLVQNGKSAPLAPANSPLEGGKGGVISGTLTRSDEPTLPCPPRGGNVDEDAQALGNKMLRRCLPRAQKGCSDEDAPALRGASVMAGVCVIAGEGVGVVTKPGLPVGVGEPAVNPVPREMLLINLREELQRCGVVEGAVSLSDASRSRKAPVRPFVWLGGHDEAPSATGVVLEVEIAVPRGVELARHTLNPRLGIVGGISILGTTGLVKPFSHEAYEETILAALTVARSNGCDRVVLSTGGKSEKLAQRALPELPGEAFVQIADFFAYSVRTAAQMGFSGIVHSVFFGKAVKMARGHAYTHAHKVALDLEPLAASAREAGYGDGLCRELASANTAQHALEILLANGAHDLIEGVARQALAQSVRMAESVREVRLLLFDQKGGLLADVRQGGEQPG